MCDLFFNKSSFFTLFSVRLLISQRILNDVFSIDFSCKTSIKSIQFHVSIQFFLRFALATYLLAWAKSTCHLSVNLFFAKMPHFELILIDNDVLVNGRLNWVSSMVWIDFCACICGVDAITICNLQIRISKEKTKLLLEKEKKRNLLIDDECYSTIFSNKQYDANWTILPKMEFIDTSSISYANCA